MLYRDVACTHCAIKLDIGAPRGSAAFLRILNALEPSDNLPIRATFIGNRLTNGNCQVKLQLPQEAFRSKPHAANGEAPRGAVPYPLLRLLHFGHNPKKNKEIFRDAHLPMDVGAGALGISSRMTSPHQKNVERSDLLVDALEKTAGYVCVKFSIPGDRKASVSKRRRAPRSTQRSIGFSDK